MNQLVNKQLVLDSFAGNVTTLQRKLIDEWYQDPLHQELFYSWLEEWEKSHRQYLPDEQLGLDKYRFFLNARAVAQKNTQVASHKRQASYRSTRLFVLAACLALAIVTWHFQDKVFSQTYSTKYGQTSVLLLPDGTSVTLNANSRIRIPRFGFGHRSREVWLDGEALFSVTHTANHQRFVVKTNNGADVVVLGTEFSMFARERGTQVVLQKGKVEFRYQQPGHGVRQVTLRPGDKVDLKKNGSVQLQSTLQPKLDKPEPKRNNS